MQMILSWGQILKPSCFPPLGSATALLPTSHPYDNHAPYCLLIKEA